MKKQYKITKEQFLEAKQAIKSNGGEIYMDGFFEIKGVEGKFEYHEEEQLLAIIITDKPWLASWSMIEEKLDEFFS